MVPALGNYLITMFKETPILLTISIIEMMSQALIIGKDKFKYTDRLTAPRCRHGLCAGAPPSRPNGFREDEVHLMIEAAFANRSQGGNDRGRFPAWLDDHDAQSHR